MIAEVAWVDEMAAELRELRGWLLDERNVDEMLEAVAGMLVDRHCDQIDHFGELGFLIRSSDRVALLKDLIEKKASSREQAWRELAGNALQALVLMKRFRPEEKADVFEIRRNRLIRGICPDCGEGVLLRRFTLDRWGFVLYCTERCGFKAETGSLSVLDDTTEEINRIAGRRAAAAQK